MTDKNELVALGVVPEYLDLEKSMAELRRKYIGEIFDVTVPEGMKRARQVRAKIKAGRVELEKIRVEIKRPALERCRLIDSEAKRISHVFREIEAVPDAAIKAEENRVRDEKEKARRIEAERVQRIKDKMDGLRFDLTSGHPVAALDARHAELFSAFDCIDPVENSNGVPSPFDYEEFEDEARALADRALDACGVALEAATVRKRAEADRAIKAKAEADRLAAEREAIEAEREKMRRAQEKIDAENNQKRKEIERQRLAVEREAEAVKKAAMEKEQAERQAKANPAPVVDEFDAVQNYEAHLDMIAGLARGEKWLGADTYTARERFEMIVEFIHEVTKV